MSHLSMSWGLFTQKAITEEQRMEFPQKSISNQTKFLWYSNALYSVSSKDMQKATYGHHLKQGNQLFESEKIS